MDLITNYNALFQEPRGISPQREIQHKIHLLHDAPLPNNSMYRISTLEMEEIKRQVQELLDQGVSNLSSSPCGSPTIIVPKNDKRWRICVDYHVLKKILVKNRYPLPRIDDLLDQLKSVVYFTKLDLRSGYHQVQTVEQDVWKNAFKTKRGLFECMVIPFGLCNAPTTFMWVMNHIF